MDQKLTIEQILQYAACDLQVEALNENGIKETFSLIGIVSGMAVVINDNESYHYDLTGIKPLLLPLSELKNEFELNGELFHKGLIIDCFMHPQFDPVRIVENRIQTNTLKYIDAVTLFKFHFDIFGLIEKDLAFNKLKL